MATKGLSGTTNRKAHSQTPDLLPTLIQNRKKLEQMTKPPRRQARRTNQSSAPAMQMSKVHQLQLEMFWWIDVDNS